MLGFHKYWHLVIKQLALNLSRQPLKWPLREFRAGKRLLLIHSGHWRSQRRESFHLNTSHILYLMLFVLCLWFPHVSSAKQHILHLHFQIHEYKIGALFHRSIPESSRKKDTCKITCKVFAWILKHVLENIRYYWKTRAKWLTCTMFSQVKYQSLQLNTIPFQEKCLHMTEKQTQDNFLAWTFC